MTEISKLPIIWMSPNIYKYKSTFTAQCAKTNYVYINVYQMYASCYFDMKCNHGMHTRFINFILGLFTFYLLVCLKLTRFRELMDHPSAYDKYVVKLVYVYIT